MTLEEIKKLHGHDCDLMYKDQIREPYTPSGMGVSGDVIYNTKTDEVICNECGWQGEMLGNHLRWKHKQYKNIAEYKDKHGLLQKVALISRRRSTVLRENALKGNLEGKGKLHLEKMLKGYRKSKYNHATMQENNMRNLCDLQIVSRLNTLAKIFKKSSLNELIANEIIKGDKQLYNHLRYKHGSINKACEAYGFMPLLTRSQVMKNRIKYSKIELISKIRDYVIKNHNIPSAQITCPANGLPSQTCYVRTFGSWRRAKIECGLYGLLQDVLTQQSQQRVLDRL